MRVRVLLAAVAVLLLPATASANPWSWRAPTPSGDVNPLNGISCPGPRLCVAVDEGGNVITTTDPTSGHSGWSRARIDNDPVGTLVGVACPTRTFCAAAGETGEIFTSNDPAGGPSRWTGERVESGAMLTSINCPAASLCVASDTGGNILTSTQPAGGSATWTLGLVASEPNFTCSKAQLSCPTPLANVTCPATGLCVAVDGQGYVLWSTDPAGGAATWAAANVDLNANYGGGTTDVSCPTTTLCVFGEHVDGVVTSTNPTGGVGAWTRHDLSTLHTVSCPLATLCVANGGEPPNLVSQNPAEGAAAWHRSSADPDASITGAACPSSDVCLAVDNLGSVVLATTRPRPAARDRPRITGTDAVGHRLIATPGTWSGARPISYAYRWQRCGQRCANIPHATGRLLELGAGDRGRRIRVTVTASNLAGAARHSSALTRRIA